MPIYEYNSTRRFEVFRPEDGGGRIFRKLSLVPQTARRHVPYDRNLDCVQLTHVFKSWPPPV